MSEELTTASIGEGLTLRWSHVETLKAMDHKLLISTVDGLKLEVFGLVDETVDALFAAYSQFVANRKS